MMTLAPQCLNKHDKIQKDHPNGRVSFLRKIVRVLEDAASHYEKMLSSGLKPNRQLIEVQSLIMKFANKLKYETTYHLNNVRVELIPAREKVSNLLAQDPSSEDVMNQKKLIQFQIDIIEEALKQRDNLRKTNSHPIERNYAEAPIFNASTPNVTTLKRIQNDSGKIIEERVGFRRVQFSSKTGSYLSSFDQKIFIGVQRLWELKGGNKEFSFKYEELCEVIEAAKDGGTYELIGASITKLSTTSIIMEDFKDAALKRVKRTEIHNLIQSAFIDHDQKTVKILFNDYLHEGLTSGNVVRINLSIYQDLNSSTTKILYPLITSVVKDQTQIDIDHIIGTLGLSDDLPRSKKLERIRKALNEFVEAQIITDYTMVKIGKTIKWVRIEPSEQLLESLAQGIMLPSEE